MTDDKKRLPLPKLETMIALCREARENVLDDINRHPELCRDRWRVDREPCLYALDVRGERLNDGGWMPWKRRKADVEALLRRFPDAHEIIVDSGVNVAASKDDYEATNYEPQFWQATIWKRDESVHSLQDLEVIVRRRTGFTSLRGLLDAKGSYRPSFDMREPEMAALAKFYDQAMTERGDDRRAYRYGVTTITAHELIERYKSLMTDPVADVETLHHLGFSKGALTAHLQPNTGGGQWLSHTVHRAGAHLLYLCAGVDSASVYRAPSANAEACAKAIWELCGEDEHLVVAEYFADASEPDDSDDDTMGMKP